MTTENTLRLERQISLSPQKCFALWTDPARLADWWGPRDETGNPFKAHSVDWDVEKGRRWRIGMTAPDGTVFRQEGEFLHIEESTELRFSFRWIDDGGARGPTTTVTVQFEADGPGTRLIFIQSGFVDPEARDGHASGWKECLDRLVLATQHSREVAT